jgi:primase-polymerase (primpol)-like protein
MDINKVDNSFHAALSSAKKADCDHQFKQIFDQKLDEINGTGIISLVDNKRNVMEQSEKILNLLDRYSGSLADPTKSLKDIGHLVDSIEKEVGLIESGSGNQVHNDKALDKIVKDLAVTAKVAMYKFHRGDFI